MPNNCSTLIQRKQHILQKILRSSSEGKLQNAVAETTAELRVGGMRKTVRQSSSTNHLNLGSPRGLNARRSNSHSNTRLQLSNEQLYDTHLPSIRDSVHYTNEREHQSQDEFRFYSRSKTHLAETSPTSTARPATASFSSIFNALSKRSTENISRGNGENDEMAVPIQTSASRRSNQPQKVTNSSRTLTRKPNGDDPIDIRLSASSGETSQQQQQQRVIGLSNRLRTNGTNHGHMESPHIIEAITTTTKERVVPGPMYQRRSNNAAKAAIKQKPSKYRRRSEEASQAINGIAVVNSNSTHRLSPTTPNLLPISPATVRRVSSDAEIQARLEALRSSMDTNLAQHEHHPQTASRQRPKSPYLYSTHQHLTQSRPTPSPQTPPTNHRRNNRTVQPSLSPSSSQNRHTTTNQRRSQQTPYQAHLKAHSVKPTGPTTPGNLYLAFIASRHLSAGDDPAFECDVDHQRLFRLFTWLKGVEEHRHEQSDHDQLLVEQNQRILDDDDNFSLYSEIQYAVDDIPANTTGKAGPKIAPMQFD